MLLDPMLGLGTVTSMISRFLNTAETRGCGFGFGLRLGCQPWASRIYAILVDAVRQGGLPVRGDRIDEV